MRLTHPAVKAVIRAILDAPAEDPAWSRSIVEQTGLKLRTTYAAIDRLVQEGWIVSGTDLGPEGRSPRVVFTPAYAPSWYETRLADG